MKLSREWSVLFILNHQIVQLQKLHLFKVMATNSFRYCTLNIVLKLIICSKPQNKDSIILIAVFNVFFN